MGDGRCFSISESLESRDETGELRMASLFGSAVFSASGSEEIEERAVVESSEFGKYRVEWIHRLTCGEDCSSSSSFVNHVMLSASLSVK